MNTDRTIRLAVMAGLILFISPLSAGAAGNSEFSISAGVDYTSGDYGQPADTEMVYLPFTARLQTSQFSLWLTVPYLFVDGPGNVVREIGPIRQSSGTTATRSESGLGDIIAGLSYSIYQNDSDGEIVDITTKIKMGTADERKDLGTGEDDYSIQADIYKRLRDFTAFGTAGYTLTGDPPGENLHNRTYYTLGASRKIFRDAQAGVMLDMSGKAFSLSFDRKEVTTYVSLKISGDKKIQYYLMIGLEEESPDAGFGLVLTHTF